MIDLQKFSVEKRVVRVTSEVEELGYREVEAIVIDNKMIVYPTRFINSVDPMMKELYGWTVGILKTGDAILQHITRARALYIAYRFCDMKNVFDIRLNDEELSGMQNAIQSNEGLESVIDPIDVTSSPVFNFNVPELLANFLSVDDANHTNYMTLLSVQANNYNNEAACIEHNYMLKSRIKMLETMVQIFVKHAYEPKMLPEDSLIALQEDFDAIVEPLLRTLQPSDPVFDLLHPEDFNKEVIQ